jgi:peptide subunit release factor 1 (eRF1)
MEAAMITGADVEKLRSVHAPGPVLLSLYVPVPLDPAGVRGLAAEAGDLMAGAGGAGVSDADRQAVRDALAEHGREWLGHTVAFFACDQVGLFEAWPLPCPLPERVVLAAWAHVRPLLAALQRCPDYRVAVADRRHSRILSVSGSQVEILASQSEQALRSHGFGGWYGLQSYRVQHRIIQLSRHHYRATAAVLARTAGLNAHVPLVIGGHHESIAGLLQALPAAVRADVAGSFAADPGTVTPARVRELASPVIQGWVARRDQELAEQILGGAPGRLAAAGLPACLSAVSQGAVAHLLVAHEDMIGGFACGRCGSLNTGPDQCPDWSTTAQAVPDLLEEMIQRTLDDGAQATVIRDAPFTVAAKLRFPVTAEAVGQ